MNDMTDKATDAMNDDQELRIGEEPGDSPRPISSHKVQEHGKALIELDEKVMQDAAKEMVSREIVVNMTEGSLALLNEGLQALAQVQQSNKVILAGILAAADVVGFSGNVAIDQKKRTLTLTQVEPS